MHGILLDADFDEPLIDYRSKGNKAELVGMDQVEGTADCERPRHARIAMIHDATARYDSEWLQLRGEQAMPLS
jgi:hypothetical protein